VKDRSVRLALWVLERCLAARYRESMAGDLVQRAGQGASHWWVWREVLAAIAIGHVRELRAHAVLTCATLLVGWAVAGTLVTFTSPVVARVFGDATFNTNARIAVALLQLCVALAISGFVMARFARPHHRSVILVAALLIWAVGLHDSWSLFLDSLERSRYWPLFCANVARAFVVGASVLVGLIPRELEVA